MGWSCLLVQVSAGLAVRCAVIAAASPISSACTRRACQQLNGLATMCFMAASIGSE